MIISLLLYFLNHHLAYHYWHRPPLGWHRVIHTLRFTSYGSNRFLCYYLHWAYYPGFLKSFTKHFDHHFDWSDVLRACNYHCILSDLIHFPLFSQSLRRMTIEIYQWKIVTKIKVSVPYYLCYQGIGRLESVSVYFEIENQLSLSR